MRPPKHNAAISQKDLDTIFYFNLGGGGGGGKGH